jgi:hypothetical protein
LRGLDSEIAFDLRRVHVAIPRRQWLDAPSDARASLFEVWSDGAEDALVSVPGDRGPKMMNQMVVLAEENGVEQSARVDSRV